MTTGVYVDVILNCFFSCKGRASERDRPYRRKKKSSGGSNRLAKAAGAEPAGQMRDEKLHAKLHAVVARSTFRSQNVKTHQVRTTFGSWDVEKSARRSGAKHISKSKCTKHHMFAPLLEVEMSKKCTPLWREANFEVKMWKALGFRITFGGSDVASLHYTTLHYTTLHYTTLHCTTLHYLPLHFTTLHYTPLHYNYNYEYTTTLHYSKLHYTTLHYTTLHYTSLHYTPLHYTTLHYTTLHWMTLHHR